MPRPEYYIIEHQRRGTFREMDSDWRAGQRIEIPRFSHSGMRNDPEKAQRFHTVERAQAMLERVIAADGLMVRSCRIRRSGDFKALCPECAGWYDHWHEHDPTCSVYRDEVAKHNR